MLWNRVNFDVCFGYASLWFLEADKLLVAKRAAVRMAPHAQQLALPKAKSNMQIGRLNYLSGQAAWTTNPLTFSEQLNPCALLTNQAAEWILTEHDLSQIEHRSASRPSQFAAPAVTAGELRVCHE